MISLHIENKNISIYPSPKENSPIIYLHSFADEGQAVWQELQTQNCPDFNLVVINQLNWDQDMTPWPAAPVFAKEAPFGGGAETYLKILTSKIIPIVEQNISGTACWRGIAGYSLAGLFALFSLYKTNLFSRMASVSGSLWYPKFCEYVLTHQLTAQPECLYFSLGDKESHTKNEVMQKVQKNTEEIVRFYQNQSLKTTFELNPGSHFHQPNTRTAAGILWLLAQ